MKIYMNVYIDTYRCIYILYVYLHAHYIYTSIFRHLKISLGPRKPAMDLLIARIAASVEMAAEAPLE